jgi:hypothetical protein
MSDTKAIYQSTLSTITLSVFILFALFVAFFTGILLDNDDLFITTSENTPDINRQQSSIRIPADSYNLSDPNLTTDTVLK